MYASFDQQSSSRVGSSSRYSSARTSTKAGFESDIDDGAVTGSHRHLGQGHITIHPSKRNSKACETCRSRRVKCQGGQPCIACVEFGMGDKCAVRAKARPNRIPKVVSDFPRAPEDLVTPANNPAAFVLSVEHALEEWTAARGYPMPLSLSDSFPLRISFSRSLPPIQHDQARDERYVDGFSTMLPYFDFIPQTQLRDILSRYHTKHDRLQKDEKALLYACFCLGRHREITMTDLNTTDRSDAEWFRRCISMLDQCERASCTALKALHCLHMHSMRAGGVSETRDILGRMASQVRELGLQRDRGSTEHPEEEKLEKMLFGTIYKDSWYATVCDQPPFLRWSEIDHDLSPVDSQVNDLDRGLDAVPFLVQLTVFENDLLSRLHASPNQSLSTDFVLGTEARWDKWTKAFREEQGRVSRPMLYIYANIRFHWLRLMLRFPCLNSPHLAQSSLAILARSVSHILQSYAASTSIQRFTASWPDLRRIVTCGQLAVLLYDQGELIKPELENLFHTMFGLLHEIRPLCPMAADATNSFRQMIRMLRLSVQLPDGENASSPQGDLPFLFDYSLPPPFEQWIYPIPASQIDESLPLERVGRVLTEADGAQANTLPRLDVQHPLPSLDPQTQSQANPFLADPNEAAAYLQLLASLHASEAFPGASQF